jgi:hypothetical protein
MSSAGSRIVAQIRGHAGDDRRMPQQEPSELERAFMNYKDMEAERNRLRHENNELQVVNGALTAEVGMLREALERCDNDRARLQAIASTFVGGIEALGAVATALVQKAIKHGIEAAQAAQPEEKTELDQAGAEVREIIERVEPAGTATAVPPMAPNEFGR